MNRRYGRFRISTRADKRECICHIFSKVFIVRCEHLYAEDVFEYVALSKYFDEVGEGFIIPFYSIVIADNIPRFLREE